LSSLRFEAIEFEGETPAVVPQRAHEAAALPRLTASNIACKLGDARSENTIGGAKVARMLRRV
jgi:hypothetical protein